MGDYREFNGVKFPFEITQSAGPQSFKFKGISVEVNKGISDDAFKVE